MWLWLKVCRTSINPANWIWSWLQEVIWYNQLVGSATGHATIFMMVDRDNWMIADAELMIAICWALYSFSEFASLCFQTILNVFLLSIITFPFFSVYFFCIFSVWILLKTLFLKFFNGCWEAELHDGCTDIAKHAMLGNRLHDCWTQIVWLS